MECAKRRECYLWCDPDARAVADIEAQGLVGAVLEQLHPPTRLRHNVHVNDGGHLPTDGHVTFVIPFISNSHLRGSILSCDWQYPYL